MPDRLAGIKGPLGPIADGFASELSGLGFKPAAASRQLCLLADLSEWLEDVGVAPTGLTTEVVAEFLQARRRGGHTRFVSPMGIGTLLGYLRGAGVVPKASRRVPAGQTEQLRERYYRFLVTTEDSPRPWSRSTRPGHACSWTSWPNVTSTCST